MDTISPKRRSTNMGAIKSKNTKPEMIVRHVAYSLGYRYRLHVKSLPGKPDLVFKSKRKTVFVHGCFWHQHKKEKCLDSHTPHSNLNYWLPKLSKNVNRDENNIRELKKNGWDVLVVWECETKNQNKIKTNLRRFLSK